MQILQIIPVMTSTHGRQEQISLTIKELLLLQDSKKKEEAVSILIGISKQGNQEATDILKKCLEEKEGITPENEGDVKWCVRTSEEEKRLQHAVEQLYNSMKKEGEDKVARQDIDEALKRAEAKLKVSFIMQVYSKVSVRIYTM